MPEPIAVVEARSVPGSIRRSPSCASDPQGAVAVGQRHRHRTDVDRRRNRQLRPRIDPPDHAELIVGDPERPCPVDQGRGADSDGDRAVTSSFDGSMR